MKIWHTNFISSNSNIPENENHDEQQKSMEISKLIVVGLVSSRGLQISHYYILKVPKSKESNNLGFALILSIHDFSHYRSSFSKPQASSKPTSHALSNAYNN
jgi:hypothetical protein